jgi:hypothetical protein
MNVGDNRPFTSSAGPEDSRVSFLIDYENGLIVARQNPSINADSGEVKAGHPSVAAVQQSNGSVFLAYNAADPFSPGGEAPAKAIPFSVNGTLALTPGVDGPKLGGNVTTFPALEIYNDRPGRDVQPLLRSWPSFADGEFGPAFGLPFHKPVGDQRVILSFDNAVSQLNPPWSPRLLFEPLLAPRMPLPPADLTSLGPAHAPPTVHIEDPHVLTGTLPPLR